MSTKQEDNNEEKSVDGNNNNEGATLKEIDESNEKEVQVNESQLNKSEVLGTEVKEVAVIKKDDVLPEHHLNLDMEEILGLNDSGTNNPLLDTEKHQLDAVQHSSEINVAAASKLNTEVRENELQGEKEDEKTLKCTRNIWISNINPKTTAGQLKLDLSAYGKVITAKIVTNGENYYGYAKLEKDEQVEECIEQLNGKKMHGYEIELSTECPQKRKAKKIVEEKVSDDDEVVNNKIKNVTLVKKIQRRRSLSIDPLTLKVEVQKCSHDEDAFRRRRRSRSGSWRQRLLQQRKNELQLKRQRELERQIEIEKRKLEQDRKQLEREKYEFYQLQKETKAKLRERLRESERKSTQHQHQNKQLKSYSPPSSHLTYKKSSSSWRRSKSPSTLHKFHHDHRRSRSKDLSRHSHKSLSGNLEKYRQEDIRPAPPPPPRLTNEDVSRGNIDSWKVYESRKMKMDYFTRNKKEYPIDNLKLTYMSSSSSPDRIKSDRKRYREVSFERKLSYNSGGGGGGGGGTSAVKYSNQDDKYGKEHKRRSYELNESKTCRSEVYTVPVRSSIYTCTNNTTEMHPTRHYDTFSYNTSQCNRNNYTNSAYPMAPATQQSNWPSRNINKDYSSIHRINDYDKRHQYYEVRKY